MHSRVGCLPLGRDSVNSQVPCGLNWGESTSEEASTSTRKTRWPAHGCQPGPPPGWLGRGKPERAAWKQEENSALRHPPGGRGRAPGKRKPLRRPSGGCRPGPPSSLGSCLALRPLFNRSNNYIHVDKTPNSASDPVLLEGSGHRG